MLDPSIKTTKKALERHHIFPRGYLKSCGIDDVRLINQVANYALLEWPDNIQITDTAPDVYCSQVREWVASDTEWEQMHEFHALPAGWQNMAYEDFLGQRRQLMAGVIRRGFEALS